MPCSTLTSIHCTLWLNLVLTGCSSNIGSPLELRLCFEPCVQLLASGLDVISASKHAPQDPRPRASSHAALCVNASLQSTSSTAHSTAGNKAARPARCCRIQFQGSRAGGGRNHTPCAPIHNQATPSVGVTQQSCTAVGRRAPLPEQPMPFAKLSTDWYSQRSSKAGVTQQSCTAVRHRAPLPEEGQVPMPFASCPRTGSPRQASYSERLASVGRGMPCQKKADDYLIYLINCIINHHEAYP